LVIQALFKEAVMGWNRNRNRRSGWSALGIGHWVGLGALLLGSRAAADGPVFLRGDANGDGKISVADFNAIFWWVLDEGSKVDNGIPWNVHVPHPQVPCWDAADANDDGVIDFTDAVVVLNTLFDNFGNPNNPWGVIPAPFPSQGSDSTPDFPGEESVWGNDLGCQSYQPMAPAPSDDIVRLEDAEAHPGQPVWINIRMTLAEEIEAFQLVIAYDPTVLSIPSNMKGHSYFSIEGTVFEHMHLPHQESQAPNLSLLQTFPDQGVLVMPVGINLGGDMIPTGTDELILKFRMDVAPDAAPGTVVTLDLTNGPDGQGVIPPIYFQNELTHHGEGLLLSVLPRRIAGRIGIVDDLTVFVRGNANGDAGVDISDPIFILDYLYTGGGAPACLDAADADDNGKIEITDAVVILESLFLDAKAISAPYPSPGKDMTSDDLSCDL
jgi:EF hand domain-containing protein